MKKLPRIHPAAFDADDIGKQVCKAILEGKRKVTVRVGWRPEPWVEIQSNPSKADRIRWRKPKRSRRFMPVTI